MGRRVSVGTVHLSATALHWACGRLVPKREVTSVCCRHLELGTVPVQGKHEAEAGVGNRVIPVQGMGAWASGQGLPWGWPPSRTSFKKSSGISRTPWPWAQHPATLPTWLPCLLTGAVWFQLSSQFPGGPVLAGHTAGLALCLGCTEGTQNPVSAYRGARASQMIRQHRRASAVG